jgi:hypothetical protein
MTVFPQVGTPGALHALPRRPGRVIYNPSKPAAVLAFREYPTENPYFEEQAQRAGGCAKR